MKALIATALVLGLVGCSEAVPPQSALTELPTTGRVDYQLGGAYMPADDVTVVARDRTAPALVGAYSICYINGFQTQPNEADFWLEKYPDLLLRDTDGEVQFDQNWPDEMALDTSTPDNRIQLADIIGEWIEGCSVSGYQAVEFDNLDAYSRFEGLSLESTVAFATALVERAHALGLDAAQKNTVELGVRGRDEIGFDLVITEECFVYEECADYAEVYGERFIDIEYQRYEPGELDGLCADESVPHLTIVRDLELSPGGDPDSVFWSCDI